MFTGIVTEMGAVVEVDSTGSALSLTIEAPQTAEGLQVGDSVAVDGACLTAVAVMNGRFVVTAVTESLQRSTLGSLDLGDRVDLERPLDTLGRFDGHLVQGHVDGVGTLTSIESEGESRRARVSVPSRLTPYLVEKGSIAVDGVSLTVTAASLPRDSDGWFETVLIPHTLRTTVLGTKEAGDQVNLEVDVVAKYVARWMEARR